MKWNDNMTVCVLRVWLENAYSRPFGVFLRVKVG